MSPLARARLLVVNDEAATVAALTQLLEAERYAVSSAGSGAEALALFGAVQPDAVIAELRGSDTAGHALVSELRRSDSRLPVLVTTARDDVRTAVRAMSLGAADVLEKPIRAAVLHASLERVLTRRALLDDGDRTRRLREALGLGLGALIGNSRVVLAVYAKARQIAHARANVLIGGDTGTGKAELARAIHRLSDRPGPFVAVDCSALAPSLLESELFGHEKGAFTGAEQLRKGRFELADGGTLFLDEVGDLAPETQTKLLEVVQDKCFTRVGGNERIATHFRLIAASHRDLRQRVALGRFREDLYYRLNVVSIDLPPLRERGGDVALLARFFLHVHAARNGVRALGVRADALAKLSAHGWPGNVRELHNVIERAVVTCRGGWLEAADIVFGDELARRPAPPIPGATLSTIRKHAILTTLEASDGSVHECADALGISTRSVQQHLRRWGLARRRGRPRKKRVKPR